MSDKYAGLASRLTGGNIGMAEAYVLMGDLLTDLDAANARADEAELALAAEREVSATYARVGDEMKARGEARIKELEGELDAETERAIEWENKAMKTEAMCEWLAKWLHLNAIQSGYKKSRSGRYTADEWLAAAREAVRDATR